MNKGENTLESRDQRANWIDVLKGLGIILVVIGHVNTKGFLFQWIYTFHMPLFFALSGYILNRFGSRVSFKNFFLKRSKTILWPFILFRTLLFAYWVGIESHFRSFDMGPIWFLVVLYIAELAAYPILYYKMGGLLWTTVICGLIAALWFGLKIILPVNFLTSWLLRSVNGLTWYLLGYICGSVEHSVKAATLTNMQRILSICGLFALSIMIGCFSPAVSLWSNSYGKNYLIFILGGIIGSMWFGFACKWFVTNYE